MVGQVEGVTVDIEGAGLTALLRPLPMAGLWLCWAQPPPSCRLISGMGFYTAMVRLHFWGGGARTSRRPALPRDRTLHLHGTVVVTTTRRLLFS